MSGLFASVYKEIGKRESCLHTPNDGINETIHWLLIKMLINLRVSNFKLCQTIRQKLQARTHYKLYIEKVIEFEELTF